MKQNGVRVHFSTGKGQGVSKKVPLTHGITFNEFRMQCSEIFEADIVSIYSRSHKRLADIAEVEAESDVFVYDSFYPTKVVSRSTKSSVTVVDTEKIFKSPSNEVAKPMTTLRIEAIGLPRAGKTSLIWSFVKNETFSHENYFITEAIFEKDIDFRDHNVHFSITDTKESGDNRSFEERLVDKEVLLFCVPKSELLEHKEWLKAVIKLAAKINSSALLVVAVTKSDLKSDKKIVFDLKSFLDSDVLVINTSIYDNYMSGEVRSSEEAFIMIAEEILARTKGLMRTTRGYGKSAKYSLTPIQRSSEELWFLKPFSSLVRCFGRRE